MKLRFLIATGLLLTSGLTPRLYASTPCPLPAPALQQGAVQAVWKLVGDTPITVGRHFALDVQLCPANATLLRVDAQMPEHRHGMNYRPSLVRLGPGLWRAQGLMFHMPGRWLLLLQLEAAGQTETLTDVITLP